MYIVYDKLDPHYRLPFVAIYDSRQKAQSLIDRMNQSRPDYAPKAYWEEYVINSIHHRARVPQ